MFSKIIVAFSTLAVLAAALPTPGGESTTVSQCNTYGYSKCCNSVGTAEDKSVASLAGLLGVVISSVDATVGLQCTDILGGQCSSTAVCCTGNKQNGLVNVGCVPITL